MRVGWLMGCAALLCASMAHGAVIGASASAGDAGVTVDGYMWDGTSGTLVVQEKLSGPSGLLLASFETDTPEDPVVSLEKHVVNDTTFAWSAYVINVTLDRPFAIDAASGPAGWLADYTQPTLADGVYTGQATFDANGAAPIGMGQIGTFGVLLSFEGSVAFCLEQIPVPEPTSLLLLAVGGLAAVRRRWTVSRPAN